MAYQFNFIHSSDQERKAVQISVSAKMVLWSPGQKGEFSLDNPASVHNQQQQTTEIPFPVPLSYRDLCNFLFMTFSSNTRTIKNLVKT